MGYGRWSICCLLVVLGWGCRGEPNRPRAADDLAVSVELHRSWVARHARLDFEMLGGGGGGGRGHGIHLGHGALPCEGAGALLVGLAATVVVVGVIYLSANGIAYLASAAGSTHVVVYPDGRADYRQRLYWGHNVVYFPAGEAVQRSLEVVVEGDRCGESEVPLRIGRGPLVLE